MSELSAPARSFRERRESEDSWLWIGFQFGIGFCTAAALLSLAAAALMAALMSSSLRFRQADVTPAPVSVSRPAAAPAHKPMRYVVPAKSVEECTRLTGGQINEDFARCRSGYVEMR